MPSGRGSSGSGRRIGNRRFLTFMVVSFLILIFGPLLLGGMGSWLGARFASLFFGDTGSPTVQKLRNDVMMLMLENSILREEALKAQEYRTLLGITRTDDRRAVPARVMYRSHGLVTGTMVLDKGSAQGVIENSVCI